MAEIRSTRLSDRTMFRPSLQASKTSLAKANRVLGESYQTALRFEYSPLKSRSKEIRLLKLPTPSSVTFPTAAECLVFEVHHVSLENTPPYAALSYHWGDPTPSHRVICNGRQHFVTKNLAQALYTVVCHFRESPAARVSDGFSTDGESCCVYLWADALCINQQDMEEKSMQIPLMSDIYTRASRVIGYVGSPKRGNPWFAIFGMISLGQAQDLSSVIRTDMDRSQSDVPRRDMDCERFPDVTEDRAGEINEFGSSPWFKRSWVTQEMVLASDVLCLYGVGPTVAHSALSIMTTLIMRASDFKHHQLGLLRSMPHEGLSANIGQIVAWATIKQKRGTSCQGLDLVTILAHTWGAEATDPRDKVFSILALLDDQARNAIPVDYSESMSAQQVYTRVAKYCISTGNAIRLLENAGLSNHLPDLPSWVPDWSRKSFNPLLSDLYKATDSTRPTVSLLENGTKISVLGIPFDLVAAFSPAVSYPDLVIRDMFSSPVETTVVLDEFARQFYKGSQAMRTRYPTKESLDQAILETLTADRSWATHQRCTGEDRQCFDAWQAKFRPTSTPLPSGSRDENLGKSEQFPQGESHGQGSGQSQSKESTDADEKENSEAFPVRVMSNLVLGGRRLCVTGTGYLGLVPESTRLGDFVAIFFGAALPFVIRKARDTGEFELVGQCYIHGAMDGEVIQSTRNTYGGLLIGADFTIR